MRYGVKPTDTTPPTPKAIYDDGRYVTIAITGDDDIFGLENIKKNCPNCGAPMKIKRSPLHGECAYCGTRIE